MCGSEVYDRHETRAAARGEAQAEALRSGDGLITAGATPRPYVTVKAWEWPICKEHPEMTKKDSTDTWTKYMNRQATEA